MSLSEDNFGDSVVSFYLSMGSRNQLRLSGLSAKSLQPILPACVYILLMLWDLVGICINLFAVYWCETVFPVTTLEQLFAWSPEQPPFHFSFSLLFSNLSFLLGTATGGLWLFVLKFIFPFQTGFREFVLPACCPYQCDISQGIVREPTFSKGSADLYVIHGCTGVRDAFRLQGEEVVFNVPLEKIVETSDSVRQAAFEKLREELCLSTKFTCLGRSRYLAIKINNKNA